MSNNILIAVVIIILSLCPGIALADSHAIPGDGNPVADKRAMVVCGNARFTILTPRLVRLEYSPDNNWTDEKTLTVINRSLPLPHFKKSVSKSSARVETDFLTLDYKNDGKPFDKHNLSITFMLNGHELKWHPGIPDTGNLLGTMRTLDGVDGASFDKTKLEKGILSRDGWAVIDDSTTPLLTPTESHWKEWVAEREDNGNTDWYFFAYGHDYKQALYDYQCIAGKAVMPPKYTLGYWWSRYWQYSDDEFKDLIGKIKSFDIPIDVLILDMDWHETFGFGTPAMKKDEFGQRVGWTGYTWQKQLFPNPANFLEWARRENLRTGLNLHPASGIQPYEDCYDDFVKEYGGYEAGKAVPYKMDEEKWADAYFNAVLQPMENMGVDFWWNDWQQWLMSKYTNGLNNTFWLNHTFFEHAREQAESCGEVNGTRPFIYHRWGGLGSHRYPLGFSGDVFTSWGTLGFLPWFTSTASNVNYGYWGHDIGGHNLSKGMTRTDPELYLRWLQFGVFTPIFKTHASRNNRIIRYPWMFPDHQFMMRDAIKLRYALAPYIYNAARENYDTGVAICRPMYYEFPEDDKAYNSPQQYFFGNDIIATSICQPVDSVTGLASASLWVPEGKWFDCSTGNMYDGPSDVEMQFTLEEHPWLARAGAIIPMNPDNVKSLQQKCDTLVLTFIPGGDGSLSHYDDDGLSNSYMQSYGYTHISKESSGNSIRISISAMEGTYMDAPFSRGYELRFPATMPPVKVTVDGEHYNYSRFPQTGAWTYEGVALQPIIFTEQLSTSRDHEICIDFEDECNGSSELYGKQQDFKRCRQLTHEYKEEAYRNGMGRAMLPEAYLNVSQCANFIEENPRGISSFLKEYDISKQTLGRLLEEWKLGDNFKERLKAQLTL